MPDDPKAAASVADAADPARSRRDHEAISKLADDLLPALIAKLVSSGLGEIEVREVGWRARLRKPAGSDAARRGAGRSAAEGHSGSGHSGSGHAAGRTQPAGRSGHGGEAGVEPEIVPISATSPAVGIYHPRRDLSAVPYRGLLGQRERKPDQVAHRRPGAYRDIRRPLM